MVTLIETPTDQPAGVAYSISHQKIELDIDILSRSLQGRAEIILSPHLKELRAVQLSCRQCAIKRVLVNGKVCTSYTYDDPFAEATLPWDAGVEQHHMLRSKVESALKDKPEDELVINFPKSVRIEEQDPFTIPRPVEVPSRRDSILPSDPDTPQISRGFLDQGARFTPITVCVEYFIAEIRDGMHFVGWEEGDLHYPHAYSKNAFSPGVACCLFPCVDNLSSRCTWELSIKCSKTIGDALKQRQLVEKHLPRNGVGDVGNGVNSNNSEVTSGYESPQFSEEDKALDLVVIGTGEMTDEVR